MHEYTYLIIGGGIAGTTAAETIRQKDAVGSIAIISDEPHRLYSRVMLSKQNWFMGKVPFEQIWLKPESWYQEKNISFWGQRSAAGLDTEHKVVTLDNGEEITYQELLIATGGKARMLGVPGADLDGVYYCRTLDQGKKILEGVKAGKKKAVILGGGFVSFELAELLKLSGVDVTIVIREDYYWQNLLEKEGAPIVEKAIADFGITIIRNAETQEVLGDDHVTGIVLKNGEKIDCDMVVCGIGIYHDNAWLKDSGVEINRGIVTNEFLEASTPHVWAAGDIAEYYDIILEETLQLGNWANAREQGHVAGLNMAGERTSFNFVSFYNAQGMGMNIAFVGDTRPGPGKVVITRHDPTTNSYGQLVLLADELIGATLINRAPEVGTIAGLVKNNVNLAGKHDSLADPHFDLKTLI